MTTFNYLAINGGKRNFTNYDDNIKFIKDFYKQSKENKFNYSSLCAKSCDSLSHRLWFDCDDTKDSSQKILDNINMILVENLIDPNTRSLITMNIGSKHKRHIKYPDIYVNNSIRKALVDKINEKFKVFDDKGNIKLDEKGKEVGYVDNNAHCGLRMEFCNKYDKEWIKNSRYVKENGEDLTIEEITGEYDILKEGEIIEIKEGLIKEVQKKQKHTKSKNINMGDLPDWVKVQKEKINQDDRFKNMTAEGKMLDNMYVLNLCQGFVCPFVNRAHSSNRNKIELFENPKKSRLTCHKCIGESENLGLSFSKCLITDEEEGEEDYFDIDKFLEIQLDEEEAESEITKKINELENAIEKLEDEIDKLDEIDPDTLSKIQKKQNRNLIKKKKREIKKISKELKKFEKLQQKEEKEEETLKDIQLAKKRIPYFEKYHCKVLSPFCYIERRRNQISMYKHTEFTHKNNNLMKGDFIKTWLETSHIKTYHKVDFYPPPLEIPEEVYNTYTGIRIDKIKSYNETDYSAITNHIKLMVGVDEETETGYNKEGYEYMLNYLSHMVQKIGELPRIALLFKGEEGTGKNIFWNLFGRKVLGREYLLETAEMNKVVGRFNMLNQKFIIILDETTGKDSFTNSDKLKNIITQDTIAWEQKGIQGITITNCGRYIFLTNNDTPIKIGLTDRRFVVFEMSPEKRNNMKYFKNLVKAFNNDDVVMSFVSFLQKRVISNWDPIGDRPMTKAYKDIQSVNVPIYARFLIDWCYKNKDTKDTIERTYKGEKLFKLFLTFLEEGNFNIQISISSFGRFIKRYYGVSCIRNTDGIKYTLKTQNIRDGLIKKGFMEKITLPDNFNDGLCDEM